MAKSLSLTSKSLKPTIYLLFLAITLTCTNSARILDEEDAAPPVSAVALEPSDLVTPPAADTPPEEGPAADIPPVEGPDADIPPVEGPDTDIVPVVRPAANVAPVVGPVSNVAPVVEPAANVAPVAGPTANVAPIVGPETVVAPVVGPVANVAPVVGPTATQPSGSIPAVATVAQSNPQHLPLSFFMHDILGGSTPSARVVTGIVANSQVNGLPFSKPNGGVFPINGGVPLVNGNNGIINNNNIPSLAGLGGTTTTVIQNNGNNNVVNGGNNLPFVSGGQIPAGATLQKLMFGTITVIDDELTEGHELGSSVMGKAQGFYLSSSLDGSSQTMALTALFHGGDHEEGTLSFFGVHRTAAPESQIAIVGGTGKYENAKGFATIQTLHPADQHTTDGVETLLQFSVYLSH